MRLSKQERIGALIILAIVILALGAFVFIKPKFEDIGSAAQTLEAKRAELQADKTKQERKKGLREEIEAAYKQGEHLADMFFPELTAYEADEAFRAFLAQCGLPIVVEELMVSEPTTATLSVSFYTPSEVTYDLKSYVSQGRVNTDDDPNAVRMAALRMALLDSQTIGASTVEFTVSALKQDDLLKFTDAVNDYFIKDENAETDNERGIRKAVSITNINLPYDRTNAVWNAYIEANIESAENGAAAIRQEVDAKNEDPTIKQDPIKDPVDRVVPTEIEFEEKLPYKYSDTFTFYSIERMQNPKAILDEQDGIVSE